MEIIIYNRIWHQSYNFEQECLNVHASDNVEYLCYYLFVHRFCLARADSWLWCEDPYPPVIFDNFIKYYLT